MENQNPNQDSVTPTQISPQAPLQPQPQSADPVQTPDPTPTQAPVEPVAAAPAKPKRQLKINKTVLIVLFVLIVLAVGGGIYYWQHGQVTQAQANYKTVSDGNTALRLQLTHLQATAPAAPAATTTATVATPTSDELVLTAAKNYCNATVDPATKKAMVLKVGTQGASKKQVTYSADKNFAQVNAVCSKDGTSEGSGSAYYFKKVNDTWVYLYHGQMSDPTSTALYNIPADFK